jgi:hypothetical protein
VPRLTLVVALFATALAAWLSQGTLALTSEGASRVALLPLSMTSGVLVALACAGVWAARRSGASLAPIWLLTLLALPWLSSSLPSHYKYGRVISRWSSGWPSPLRLRLLLPQHSRQSERDSEYSRI